MTITQAFAQFELEKLHNKGRVEKTRVNYRTALSSFLKTTPDIPVQMITYDHIVLWQLYMDQKGNAISYQASQLGRLRNVLKYLKTRDKNVLDPDKVELPKVKKKKVEFLYAEEIQRMIDSMENPRNKALIAMSFSCGGRISEVLSLNRQGENSINQYGEAVITGKNDKEGTLRFDTTALQYLQAYLDTRKDKLRPLFISGQRRRLGYARANQIVHEASDLAGIDINVTTHTMRHSFATDLRLNGADIVEVKEHLRHEDISTTMRYVHIQDKHTQESYRRHHTVLK